MNKLNANNNQIIYGSMRKSNKAFSTAIIFFALVLLGLSFIPLLSVQLNPSSTLPSLTVSYYWQNASPEILEQEVTSELEGLFSKVRGISKITSVSSKNNGQITISFDKHTDIDFVRFEISSIIRQVYSKLPVELSYPVISVNRPDNAELKPVLTYTLNGPVSPNFIQQYAEKSIKKKLSVINGIDKIEVYGSSHFEWQITYDKNIIQNLSINYHDILTAIRQYFDKQTLGTAYKIENQANTKDTFVSSISVILRNKVDEKINWSAIPVKKTGNRIIYLTDITNIKYKEKTPDSYFRINGLNSIYLVIYPNKGINNLVLSNKIKDNIQNIINDLPAGYSILLSSDTTEYIKAELSKIYYRTFFTIIILLLFVVLISRNLRYVLIIIISLFSNISICFALYYFFRIEIHLYSLAGITISLGIIIDNSIVMIDHLKHQHNKKVFLAILASTLTTIAALSIIFFLPENIKLNLWDFAVIIMVNMSVSLLVALFFIPALMNLFKFSEQQKKLKTRRRKRVVNFTKFYEKIIVFLSRYKKTAITIAVLSFGIPVFLLPNKVEEDKWYAELYNNTIGSEWYIENFKPSVNKFLGGTLRLFNYYVFEQSYYSKPEKTALYVSASMPKGSTTKQMNSVFKQIESHISQYNEIQQYITKIYSSQNSEMTIYFKKDFENSAFPYILKSKLISKSIDLGGMSWNIYGVGKGFSSRAGTSDMINYAIVLYGYNYDMLYEQAKKFEEKLLKHPRVQKVNISGSNYWWKREKLYEYNIDIDKNKLALKGISVDGIYAQLKKISLQNYSDLSYIIDGKYKNIKILSKQSSEFDIWNMFHSPVSKNGSIKLEHLSEVEKKQASSSIYKENQQYIRIVKYNYLGSSKFGNLHLKSVLDEMKDELPLGYYAKQRSWSFWNDNNEKQYYLIFLIIILVYFICAILFESFIQPLAIISIIPLSFIGIFLTFYLFDYNFDQGGYASFILLSGIVVNSSIYITNEFNNLRKVHNNHNISKLKLYLKAYNNKIVPILLTIISTILGLVPFIVYGQNEVFWFALAVGSIGGLLFSIIVLFLYLPLFFRFDLKHNH
jgi:multidrug efflux pump subunit AcrB